MTQKAPYKGPGADSEEKREPASDIDTAQVNSLKVLDPEWPIREAGIQVSNWMIALGAIIVILLAYSFMH